MKRNRLKKKAVTKKDMEGALRKVAEQIKTDGLLKDLQRQANREASMQAECATLADPVLLALTGIRFRTPTDKQDAVRVIHSMIDQHREQAYSNATEESRYYRQVLEGDLRGARDQIARLEASIHQIHRDHGQQIIDAITRNPTTETMGLAKEATDVKRNR